MGLLLVALLPANWAVSSTAASAAGVIGARVKTSPNGPAITLTFDTAGEAELVAFIGLSGQQVTVTASNGTFTTKCDLRLRVIAPGGTPVTQSVCAGTSSSLGPIALGVDGTYKARLVAGASATGSITVAITSSGTIASITPNAEMIPISITAAYQKARFGFAARAGDRYSAVATSGDISPSCRVALSIVDAVGQSIGGNTCVGAPSTDFVDAGTIPADGIYYLQAYEHDGSTTPGAFKAKVLRVVDVARPIVTDGTPDALTIRTPGQNAEYSFSGTAGQRIAVLLSDYTINGGCFIDLIRPDDTQLAWSSDCYIGADGYLDATTLDSTGTWTLRIDPNAAGPWVGTATVQAFTVVDVSGSIRPGREKKFIFDIPGTNASYKFSGVVGDQRTITVTDISTSSGIFSTSVLRPDGSMLDGRYGGSPDASFEVTLDTTGTWTIFLNPGFAQTGQVYVALN